MRISLSTILPILLFFGPTAIGILLNQTNPSAGSALGVAYFALLSILLGLLCSTVVALLSWRKVISAPNVWILGGAFLLSIALFAVANSGALSRVA